MEVSEEIEERIEFWIRTKFYYVAYPDPVDEYWWQDREGQWQGMADMSLDHLKASAKLIERDLKNAFSPNDDKYTYYKKFILEPALAKKSELEEVFRGKVKL